ncbi:MAG: macro domain-containing protein [Polyangiaceae bacterium]
MLRFMRGNLFDSEAEALVNTVNCVGVMGKGIAYQFRRAYPEMFANYERLCRQGQVRIGEVTSFQEKGRTIVNFPTKTHWRAPSRLEDVRAGLDSLRTFIVEKSVPSIALPPLGCGNGGLAWNDVREAIESSLADLAHVTVEVYEPIARFESKVAREPRLSLGHFVVVALRQELSHPSKIALQKAAYFFNVFWGEPYFKFTAYRFGPYSLALDPMFNTIRDYLSYSKLSTEDMLRDGIARKLSGHDGDRLRSMLVKVSETASFCNQRAPRLEVLATTHAVVSQHPGCHVEEIVKRFLDWSQEKKERFTRADVLMAITELETVGLLRKTLLGYEVLTQGGMVAPNATRPQDYAARPTKKKARPTRL